MRDAGRKGRSRRSGDSRVMVNELVAIEPGGHLVPLHLSRGQDFFWPPHKSNHNQLHTTTAWLAGRYIEVGTEKEREAPAKI